MKNFVIRTINLLLILTILLGYNTVIHARAQQNDIARLQAELEESQDTVTDVKTEIKMLADSYASSSRPTEKEKAEDDGWDADESGLADGVYEGEAQGFGGMIAVNVSVKDGMVERVEIASAEGEDPAYLEMAKSVAGEIVEAQSADVDTVSGATFSSTGIRDAAAKALEKAVR